MNNEEQEVRSRYSNNNSSNNNYDDNDNFEREELIRRPSRLDDRLTKSQKLDIRAHQRTYQGAYIRTCIGCLSFSLLVMKLFSKEFMSIGLVFQIYSLLICIIGYNRASNMDLYFIDFNKDHWYKDYIPFNTNKNRNLSNYRDEEIINGHLLIDNKYYFKTSGNYVIWLSLITLLCYIVLFILLVIM